MTVSQDVDALVAQRLGNRVRIHAEIMVPEHRVYTVTRAQPTEKLCRWPNHPPGIRNEVAGEGNDVRVQAVRLPHGLGKPFLGEKQTVMNVGNLNDAQAVELARERIEPNALLVHAEPLARSPRGGW